MIRSYTASVDAGPRPADFPAAAVDAFEADVVAGLSADPKRLSCKYFYDQRGSKLFDAICELDEYYLTRTELAIMRRYAPQMAREIGSGAMLIEYGSGSSLKTRLLLKQLRDPAAYVPVDISGKHLHTTARKLSRLYPQLDVLPVAADFTEDFELPQLEQEPPRRVVYFPGSTVGNFEPPAAADLLARMASTCGAGGGLLIGIDLQKNVHTIEAAYNDAQGVTAQFNLNLLRRINRELGANFNLDQFRHWAVYDAANHRMDIRLVSNCDQTVELESITFHFSAGEPIHTEYSHKYAIEGFTRIAAEAGFSLQHRWTDPRHYFAVLFFVVPDKTPKRNHDPLHRLRRKPR